MMIYNQIERFFRKYSNLSNLSRNEYYALGGVIFLLKISMVLLISFLDWKEGLSFYTNAGDDGQYIGYSENLYKTGEYFYDFGKTGVKDYFFRMPGITFLYYPLRFFFNQAITINLVVIIQVLLSTIATLKFIELINKYFKVNNLLFLFFSVFYAYTAFLDASLMTESLALSSLLLCFYYLEKALSVEIKKSSFKFLFFSGFFLTWMIFLRPFMIPFLLLLVGTVFIKKRKVIYCFIFTLPFLLIDGAWLYRNYKNHNEFIVLQNSMNWIENGNKSLPAKMNFIQSFGFTAVNFEENSESTWFNNRFEARSVKIPPNSIFSERTFVGEMTLDSLIRARELMHRVVDKSLPPKERIASDKEAARILNKFVYTLKEENPFDYYLGNRIRLFFSFLEPNTPKLFKHGPYPINIAISFMDVLFSILIKYGGLIGLFYLFFRRYKDLTYYILYLSVPVYLFILFPIVLRLDETRFFYLSYPFLLILFLNLLNILRLKKNTDIC